MSSSCAPTEVEVVALSPPELLGCNGWYVCEACGRGFRRHHNLRQHRRRHAASSDPVESLNKREPPRRRVFVCPEPGCRRHAASDALANLPSLKKHFRRKHGRHGLWACGHGRGTVAIAAAAAGGGGTSGLTCDGCGRVFSQLEYVEHQGTCRRRPHTSSPPPPPPASGVLVLAAATSTSQQQGQLHAVPAIPSGDKAILVVSSAMAASPTAAGAAASSVAALAPSLPPPAAPPARPGGHDLDLQLTPPDGTAFAAATCCAPPHQPAATPRLDLSLGLGGARYDAAAAARLMVEEAREQLLLAMAEKATAEEDRARARRRAELAGLELASAQRMRQQAQVELRRAHAAHQLANARLLQVTCCTAAADGSSTMAAALSLLRGGRRATLLGLIPHRSTTYKGGQSSPIRLVFWVELGLSLGWLWLR